MRDPAHAGECCERVRFLEGGLDANDDRRRPELVEIFDCRAQVEAEPGPAHVQAERIEAAAVIYLTRALDQARTAPCSRASSPGGCATRRGSTGCASPSRILGACG